MPYVDSNKKLSSPTKCARLYYLLNPFINNFELKRGGGYSGKNLQWYFDRAKLYAQDRTITGALESYQTYHLIIKEKLKNLKNKRKIFIPGRSADLGEFVSYTGRDIFSENFLLSSVILEGLNFLDEKENMNLEGLVIFPIGPFIMPAVTTRDYEKNIGEQLYLSFPFENLFEEVNNLLPKKKRVSSTYLEKRLDNESLEGRKGAYDFSDLLYNFEAAKKAIDDLVERKELSDDERKTAETHAKYSIYLNKQITNNAWNSVFTELCEERPAIFAKKSSYVWEILRFSDRKFKRIGGDRGPMRNTSVTPLGESHKSAINVLKGYLIQNAKT